MKVYIVLQGYDCEGAYVKAVFSREEDAIKYLDRKYKYWKKIGPDYRTEACESAFIEEWDVIEEDDET